MNLNNIKKENRWIVWRYEDRTVKEKPAKVPYNPNYRKYIRKKDWKPERTSKGYIPSEYTGSAKSNVFHTWGLYEDAIKAIEFGIFDGVGIMLGDGLCGIDVDHCINENGELSNIARDIISSMNSYTEFSPSGTGIHILCYGKLLNLENLFKKNSKEDIEIYSDGRYFTFTGRKFNDLDIEERTLQINSVQLKYMKKGVANNIGKIQLNDNLDMSDDTLINIALRAKNGERFRKLFYGEISEYNSQSEADLALCSILAFYTNCDNERINRLFRKSRLYRSKWERDDYRENTIVKAIQSINGGYQPSNFTELPKENIIEDNKNFLIVKGNKYKVVVPLLEIYIKNKHDIKFNKGQFKIKKNNYYSHIENIKYLISSEIPEKYRYPEDITKCEALLSMDADLILNDEDLAKENYISFNNGVLDISNMKFYNHCDNEVKNLNFINQVGYNYNPNAEKCKYVEQFFKSVTNDNTEDINFLYQVVGVTISGYREFKNILYFKGVPDSGKSTYLKIIQKLLTSPDGQPDYSNIGLKSLTDETSFEYVPIIGKRANLTGETCDVNIKNDVLLKQLSGHDSIKPKIKFGYCNSFVNKAILIFAGNHDVKFFTNEKSSIADRMIIYNFKTRIPKSKQIKKLENKINMEYLILKAIDQLKVFVNNNQEFNILKEAEENRERALLDSDEIYRFYKECIQKTQSKFDRISVKGLYNYFTKWMSDEGYIEIGKNGEVDLNITRHKFTREIKKLHNDKNFIRNVIHDGVKTDIYINMKLII